MSNYTLASLSYRVKDKGGAVSSRGKVLPSSGLNKSSLLILIHGYNNDQINALKSYQQFLELQEEIKDFSANILEVFWPGDNWEGFLYYMQSIGKVKEVAKLFAQDIYNAASARGFLVIDFIAHSLGCRLILETINILLSLQRNEKVPGLVIRNVVFMAGAVPVNYLNERGILRDSVEYFKGALSLFSQSDSVLHYGFPIGQTLAREGIFPVALGRRKWADGNNVVPRLNQINNQGANHSDYWGADSKKPDILKNTAKYVRTFIDMGAIPNRKIVTRNTSTYNSLSRDIRPT